jgi:hypothetical protein
MVISDCTLQPAVQPSSRVQAIAALPALGLRSVSAVRFLPHRQWSTSPHHWVRQQEGVTSSAILTEDLEVKPMADVPTVECWRQRQRHFISVGKVALLVGLDHELVQQDDIACR